MFNPVDMTAAGDGSKAGFQAIIPKIKQLIQNVAGTYMLVDFSNATAANPVATGGTGSTVAGIAAFNNITGYSAAGATGTTSTNLVFSTSPVLITPNLGTPSALVLTNATALPANQVVAGALANGMTATTQTNGDNSTKLATTAYADAKKHGFGGQVGSVIAAGATNYINPGNTTNATENNVKIPCGFAGTFTGISVYLSTAQPGTGSLVFILRINGANTALTFTVPAGSAAGVYSDLANSVAFTAGDTYNLSVQNNAAASSASIRSIQYTYTS